MPKTTKEKIEQLREIKSRLYRGGGEDSIQKQHEKGKMTARERIDTLMDTGSFQELFLFSQNRCPDFGLMHKEMPGDGVVTGLGAIDGRQAFVASQDFTVAGGSVGEMHADKICQIMDMALKCGGPFVFVNDSGGARIQEGIGSLSGYGRIFYRNVLLSGPQVIKEVTGEDISEEELGGVYAQMTYSGVVHFVADNDVAAIALCKKLLSFLPANNMEDPPDHNSGELDVSEDEELNAVIPDNSRDPYDVKIIIRKIVDWHDFLEIQEHFAANVIIGLARINGRTVGIVANQPSVMAGVLDINASDKIGRFVRFCNAFNIPLITLVDVPGFLPGVQQEYGGIIRHGAKVLFAYSAATVPKIAIIMRKAYGGAYLAMCGKDLGCDRVACWPTGEIAVMGAEGAVKIVYRHEIKAAADQKEAARTFTEEYLDKFANPYAGAARNIIDDIIEPKETRRYLSLALESLRLKRELRPQKKHGLIPL